jgi:hypothetical protein
VQLLLLEVSEHAAACLGAFLGKMSADCNCAWAIASADEASEAMQLLVADREPQLQPNNIHGTCMRLPTAAHLKLMPDTCQPGMHPHRVLQKLNTGLKLVCPVEQQTV